MRRDELSQAELPVFLIPVDAIDVPDDRLRSLKEAIGAASVADGQYDPITVAQLPGQEGFTLVDGLHRLEGCRRHGLALIEARIGSPDRTARRRQEVLSAWARADHDVFDKAAQVAEMVELAKIGWGHEEDASITMILGGLDWEDAVCEALGIGRATLFRHLKLHRFFTPEKVELLRERGFAGELMPLVRLISLPKETFVTAWVSIQLGQVESIAEALASVAPAPVNSFDKSRQKVVKQVNDWPAGEIRDLIDELRRIYAEKVKPA
ncbi:ParB N-terminal domain-containing protein [Polymorphobacter sp.]|uniref:ParB N-terminal domain-containing protein n=1 Tax=Polymorphobacter sp. TaxID=1909290 RepID=UPI003F7102B9